MLSFGLLSCGGDGRAPNAPEDAASRTSQPVAAASTVTLVDDDDVAEAAPPVVNCVTHVEPSVKRFDPRRDIVRGPFALVTVRSDLNLLSRASYEPRGGRLAAVKLPIGLRAGHRATLSISTSQRGRAALIYRERTHSANRVKDGDEAVSFEPCSADTPAFSGGVVGPITGWAGAMIVTGPGCIRLRLRVDDQRRPDIRLPLGHRCR